LHNGAQLPEEEEWDDPVVPKPPREVVVELVAGALEREDGAKAALVPGVAGLGLAVLDRLPEFQNP
jgi:hypothetical protein